MNYNIIIVICVILALLGVVSLVFGRFLCVTETISRENVDGSITTKIVNENNLKCFTVFEMFKESKRLNERMRVRLEKNHNSSFNFSLLSSSSVD